MNRLSRTRSAGILTSLPAAKRHVRREGGIRTETVGVSAAEESTGIRTWNLQGERRELICKATTEFEKETSRYCGREETTE